MCESMATSETLYSYSIRFLGASTICIIAIGRGAFCSPFNISSSVLQIVQIIFACASRKKMIITYCFW